jgi:hypothetical protein
MSPVGKKTCNPGSHTARVFRSEDMETETDDSSHISKYPLFIAPTDDREIYLPHHPFIKERQ